MVADDVDGIAGAAVSFRCQRFAQAVGERRGNRIAEVTINLNALDAEPGGGRETRSRRRRGDRHDRCKVIAKDVESKSQEPPTSQKTATFQQLS